jgi:hypothetical protein
MMTQSETARKANLGLLNLAMLQHSSITKIEKVTHQVTKGVSKRHFCVA